MTSTISRRAALTGATASVAMVGAAVVVAAPVTSVSPERRIWDAAFTRYNSSYAAAEAGGWRDDLTTANGDDWANLIFTPAPDAKALHWKLHYLFGDPSDDTHSGTWANEIIAAVLADARRLADAEG